MFVSVREKNPSGELSRLSLLEPDPAGPSSAKVREVNQYSDLARGPLTIIVGLV